MAEEDSIMKEAAKLMRKWKVPADFREFVADCCYLGVGAEGGWERELDVRKWSLQLLKAVIADGSVFSGEWDSLLCSAVLPVPMPAFMLKNALAYEMEVAAKKSGEVNVTGDGEGGGVSVVKGGEEKGLECEREMEVKEEGTEMEEEVKCGEEEDKAESLSPLPPFWGATLPPSASSQETSIPWRPWEGEKIDGKEDSEGRMVMEEERKEGPSSVASGRCKKRRSKAAAARSMGRLLRWQEKLEPQLGPSRLQLELRCATPGVLQRGLRRTNLASKFDEVQAEPCLQWGTSSGDEGGLGAQGSPQPGVLCQDLVGRGREERRGFLGLGANQLSASTSQPFPLLQQLTSNTSISFPTPPPSGGYLSEWKGERRELPGSGDGGKGLYAGGFKHFTSLLQIPTTISAESSFPTPPPPPNWSAKWRGDWWLVPAGMSTQCASCCLWGPLSPGP